MKTQFRPLDYINSSGHFLERQEVIGVQQRHKSCLLSNERPSKIHHDIQSQASFTSIQWQNLKRARYVLLVVFILFLGLYAYIVIFPQPSKRALAYQTMSTNINCFEQFRLNGCNLEKPAGSLCQNLHLCMTGKNQNVERSPQIGSTPKLASIQQFLENFLLLFVGMGIMGFFKRVLRSNTWFELFKQLLKKFGNCIKMLRIARRSRDNWQNEENKKDVSE